MRVQLSILRGRTFHTALRQAGVRLAISSIRPIFAGLDPRPPKQGMLETSTVTRTGLYVSSPTKGNMELVTGKIWEINENDLPDFEWVPSKSRITSNVKR